MSARQLGPFVMPQPPSSVGGLPNWTKQLRAALTQALERIRLQGNWSVPLIGTWTPAVTAASTAGTPAYTTQDGRYTLIGDDAWLWGKVVLSGWTGSPSGDLRVTGLPWAAGSVEPDALGTASVQGGATFSGYLVANIAADATFFTVQDVTSGGSLSNMTASTFGTTGELRFHLHYRRA